MENKENIGVFPVVMQNLESMMDLNYQERIWARHEDMSVIDSYDDTTMYFTESTYAMLDCVDGGRANMTKRQYDALKRLFEMVETFDEASNRPREDKDIVKDPRWIEISEFAKEVHEELTKPS